MPLSFRRVSIGSLLTLSACSLLACVGDTAAPVVDGGVDSAVVVDASRDVTPDVRDAGAPDAPGDVVVDAAPTPRPAGIAGFAYAHQPSATSPYAPPAAFAYDAAGGAITVNRAAGGYYVVTFADLNLTNANVQVTTYGTNAKCNLDSFGGSNVMVRCFDWQGYAADSAFTVAVVTQNVVTDAEVLGYAQANDPSSASYVPPASFAYSAGGGAISAARGGVGVYALTLTGVAPSAGNVQVSAFGGPALCTVAGWSASTVDVRCYGLDGKPADSRYTLLYLGTGQKSTAKVIAYALANDMSSSSYTPLGVTTYNSGGQGISATRAGAGIYSLDFGGLGFVSGSAKVTTYGVNTKVCQIAGWTGTFATNCYLGVSLSDTQYSVLVVK